MGEEHDSWFGALGVDVAQLRDSIAGGSDDSSTTQTAASDDSAKAAERGAGQAGEQAAGDDNQQGNDNQQGGDDQGGGGQPQGGDDQPSDGGGEQVRTIRAGIRTHYEQSVRYWIYDQAPSGVKLLVDGEAHPGGDVIWLVFESGDGSGGSAGYQRESYPDGGGLTPFDTILVTDGQISDMKL